MTQMLLISGILFFTSFAFALNPGESLKEFSLEDQYGVESKVDKSVRYHLFAKDKKASEFIEDAFKKVDKDYFSKKNLVYVADVSGMPGFVLSWFARPKMKKYPFKVLIGEKPEVTKSLPTKKDQVSLIFLDNLKVLTIEYFENTKKLQSRVGALK